jgi:hypothetical protein
MGASVTADMAGPARQSTKCWQVTGRGVGNLQSADSYLRPGGVSCVNVFASWVGNGRNGIEHARHSTASKE